MNKNIRSMAVNAKKASVKLAILPSKTKNAALSAMSKAVLRNKDIILKANQKDVKAAQQKGLSQALIGRLELNEQKIKKIAESLAAITKLPDPIGRVIS